MTAVHTSATRFSGQGGLSVQRSENATRIVRHGAAESLSGGQVKIAHHFNGGGTPAKREQVPPGTTELYEPSETFCRPWRDLLALRTIVPHH